MRITVYRVTFLFSLAGLLSSCESGSKQEVAKVPPATVTATELFPLQKQAITSNITLPAELTGFRQVDIFAKVSSYVKTLKVDIGSTVKEGQLLIELEAPEISSQLAAATSRQHSQEAIYTASNSTYQRILETSKTEGTISNNDLEQAASRKDADLAQLEAARATIRELKVMQGYLQIRAPFTGKITARNINTGAYVGQATQLPLLTLQDQKKLRLSVSVPEAYTSYIKVGDELSFKVVSLRGETFKAKIARKSGALDARLRSEKVELDVANTAERLLPGMVAEVGLSLTSRKDPFSIPRSAMMSTSEGIFVIKSQDHKARRVKVEPGLEAGGNVEIFSEDLKAGDSLVLHVHEEIREGSALH